MTGSDAGGDYSTRLLLAVVVVLFIHFDRSVDQFLLGILAAAIVCVRTLVLKKKDAIILKDKRLGKKY